MNESIEESNSLSPVRSNRQAPTAMAGVHGATSSPNPADPDSSWYEYPDVSGVQAETSNQEFQAGDMTAETDDNEGQVKEGGEGEQDAKSETSSVMFDYDVDPEGFARRLDELAGTLEVGEEEARALRWGPAIGKEGKGQCQSHHQARWADPVAPLLSTTDFKALVNHHLDTTEWRYTQNNDGTVEGRGGAPGGQMASHPIKVLGPVRGALGQGQAGI